MSLLPATNEANHSIWQDVLLAIGVHFKALLHCANAHAGSLPSEWGEAHVMPQNIEMYFNTNPGIQGSIPQSWVWFSSSYVGLERTNVTGCCPGETCSFKMSQDHPSHHDDNVQMRNRYLAYI
jgi:hypothetical protein